MINKAWHDARPMPPKATLDQRVDWHREHAKACACRKMPVPIAEEIAARAARAAQSEGAAGG